MEEENTEHTCEPPPIQQEIKPVNTYYSKDRIHDAIGATVFLADGDPRQMERMIHG